MKIHIRNELIQIIFRTDSLRLLTFISLLISAQTNYFNRNKDRSSNVRTIQQNSHHIHTLTSSHQRTVGRQHHHQRGRTTAIGAESPAINFNLATHRRLRGRLCCLRCLAFLTHDTQLVHESTLNRCHRLSIQHFDALHSFQHTPPEMAISLRRTAGQMHSPQAAKRGQLGGQARRTFERILGGKQFVESLQRLEWLQTVQTEAGDVEHFEVGLFRKKFNSDYYGFTTFAMNKKPTANSCTHKASTPNAFSCNGSARLASTFSSPIRSGQICRSTCSSTKLRSPPRFSKRRMRFIPK